MPREEKSIFYNKRRVLIPGGAGFIGSNLAGKLIASGADVTIVDSFEKSCGANISNLSGIEKKATIARERVEDFIKGCDIAAYDIIFNCIGLTDHHIGYEDPALDYEINCLSGLRILEKLACSKSRARLVSIGTRNQYGKSASVILDESSVMNPLDVQAIHKVALERYHSVFASRYGLDTIFARMTNTYGPAQKLKGGGIGVVGELIRNALTGEDVVVYGDMSRVKDLIFVDDAVSALLSIGMLPSGKAFDVYNVGGHACAMAELTDAVKACLPVKVKIVPFPDKIKKMDTGDTVLDTKKIRKATGWKPTTGVKKGIAMTMDYYKSHRNEYL
ncbi:MAG: NAD-dependent epimerase/dehydratase family protein [Candidatus Omnitrophota bacterium]